MPRADPPCDHKTAIIPWPSIELHSCECYGCTRVFQRRRGSPRRFCPPCWNHIAEFGR